MTLYGVDVHDGYQAGILFPLLVEQGYSFAAIKLTEGTSYHRPGGVAWVKAARAAGLIPGAYHFLRAGDGAAQARWFHQHVVMAGGPRGMLIQLDCEADGYAGEMAAWAQEWRQLSGGHPFLIYSGAWWWKPRVGTFRGADLTPYLWHSHYLSADTDAVPDDPARFAARIPASWWAPDYGGWGSATMVQITSEGDAGGLANMVDLNVFPGSRADLLALTGTENDMAVEAVLVDAPDAPHRSALNNMYKWLMHTTTTVDEIRALLTTVASKMDFDEEELAAISSAATTGLRDAAPAIVDAIIARLPAGTMTKAEVVQAVQEAFAHGLAPSTPDSGEVPA